MTLFSMKWGSAEHLTKALFSQDKVWVTAQAEVRKIAEMSPQHCLNTLLMIERMSDLPVKDLQRTPLYAALYDRVLSFLPKEVGTQTGRIPNTSGPVWPHPAPSVPFARRVGVERDTILSILEAAIAAQSITPPGRLQPRVLIDYTDVEGNKTTGREIIPTEIQRQRAGFGFTDLHLRAYDVAKESPRMFKIDRISRCEDA